MGRFVKLHITLPITTLILVIQLYLSAADSACSCKSSALQCHGITPELQQQLINQLGSCTATGLRLKQQLLRQQHHTPVIVALDSSGMWQLLPCAVLLVLFLFCTAQACASRRKCAALQQALQRQCTMTKALYSSRQQLQKQLYQHQQRNAAWAASLQHMQWLVVDRAAALAAQEAILSNALGVTSMVEAATDTSHAADQLISAADMVVSPDARTTQEAEPTDCGSQGSEAQQLLAVTAPAKTTSV
ncbi:hypothetical protein COO60DRAFT_316892 [Scenedesmus sp. NREL 46B-D3]|nr:hypothetical protein COO60DRAFT_316892 [Scenedesmus sp. NREL 46B-D3]